VNAIEIDSLVKDYGSLRAVDGVSFEVAAGEFFGLLGPNGAGKSTILNILAGLTRPTQGKARVMGKDVVREFRSSRRNLGVVPQELVFDSFFPIYDVLRTQSGYFGLRNNDDWIDYVLERLHLTEQRDYYGRQLSGGMKRRLLVAKALVHRPPVVILDEPTAGVDVELRRHLWEFIEEIHRAGTTILLTTHYLEEAESYCQRIGIIGKGKLLALESTESLLAKHTDREVVLTFADRQNGDSAEWARFGPRLSDDGCKMSLRTYGEQDRAALWRQVKESGVEIVDVEVKHPDLEDVFLELTAGQR